MPSGKASGHIIGAYAGLDERIVQRLSSSRRVKKMQRSPRMSPDGSTLKARTEVVEPGHLSTRRA